MRRLFLFRKATQVLISTLKRRRRSHATRRPAAAIAGSEPPVGHHRSPPKPPKPGAKISTSRKRRRSHDPRPAAGISGQPVGGNESTSSTKISSTPAGSMPCTYHKYGREILVLFETPSGFAIFCMDEYFLNQPNAKANIWAIFGEYFRPREVVWLKEFQTFNEKSSAINDGTGVNMELTDMIMRYHRPRQTLAVGKPEYKRIIETSLGVPCHLDETMMEVMWGLKNLMHRLVPQEEVKLTMEDRLPMSQGLKMFLERHGFDVKPEMVNEDVVVTACLLSDIEVIEKRYSEQLCWAADKLKDVSGIHWEGWSPMKIATALKIMFDPVETTDYDIEMFTKKEVSTLEMDAPKYEDIICDDDSLKIWSELVVMGEVKKDALEILGRHLA